jgi:hypothetical protein
MPSPNGMTPAAEDAHGSLATGYQGVVHIGISDSTATPSGNGTYTASDAGVHTVVIGVFLPRKGKHTFAVTDTQDSALAPTDSIPVV